MDFPDLFWLFRNPTPPQAVDELEEKRWTFLTNLAALELCREDLAEAQHYAQECRETGSVEIFRGAQEQIKGIEAALKDRDAQILEYLEAEPSQRPQFVQEYQRMLATVELAEELTCRTLRDEGAEDLKYLCTEHNFFTSAMTGYSWMISDAFDFVFGLGYYNRTSNSPTLNPWVWAKEGEEAFDLATAAAAAVAAAA